MGCIWQPFYILQEKVGISFYFWIIRVLNSQLALYSHVRCNPLDTPQKTPHITITNFNYEGSYLPGLICNIVVKADLGRYPGRSIPQMHHWIYIMGCIWQPFCILQEKVGISCFFWIIRIVNSQLTFYSHVICNPLETPENTPKWQLQISTMRAHIWQFQYVILLLKLILADILADLSSNPPVLTSSGQE